MSELRGRVSASQIAGVASLGAGAVHAAAAGIHAAAPSLARLFVAIAAAQLIVGVLMLRRRSLFLAVGTAVVNATAVAAWTITRFAGISWIGGLERSETPQLADSVCAALGVIAVAGALLAMRPTPTGVPGGLGVTMPSVAIGAVAVAAMLAAVTSVHAHDESAAGQEHGAAATAEDHHDVGENAATTTTPAQVPGGGATTSEGHRGDGATAGSASVPGQGEDHSGGDHAPTPAVAVPYDPTKPIDLSGVEGVTPEQQAFAENLVSVNVVRLPQWSDPAVAEAAGFRSIGDAASGHEHYIQWDWIDDDVWLDPDAPESLVYEPQPDGTKKLVSAMYMLPDDMTLADVPDDGGKLMQWHIHDNLCFTDDPVAPQVGGLRPANGACRPPLVVRAQSPMIHVWIVPNECGPFAALEGVGAGSVQAGEERWCDAAHGS